ncbi:Terminal uridylyltransferase Tailor [Gryllus bimaculatus]|nr:Terminal uridylyltransferase Tailor [Gryllus bimaculatus]
MDQLTRRIKGGFASLGKLRGQEQDRVPRVLVKCFRRNTKPFHLYTVFNNFGTITYLAVKKQQAVVEFSNWAAVDDILKCKLLKVQRSRVHCESLRKFIHLEPNQFQANLHNELTQLDTEDSFKEYVTALCKEAMDMSAEDCEAVCRRLEEITRPVHPHCKAFPFGSRLANLGFPGCDLDLFLDCGNMFNGEYGQTPIQQRILAEAVLKRLLQSEDFARIHSVLHARVPVLKFLHVPTGTRGDVAFRNGLGVQNSRLLCFLQTLDDRVRPLLLFLKRWARLQSLSLLTENYRLTSYALATLVVFFLQQLPEPVLPPIRDLMDLHAGYQRVIAGWPCSFTRDPGAVPKTRNTMSVMDLALGFLQFYQFYEYRWFIICPYLGRSIGRKELDNIVHPEGEGDDLALEFSVYVDNVRNGNSEIFPSHTPVCIQDPFEHSQNVSRNIRNEGLMNFISSCGLMYEKLKTLLTA